MNTTIRNAVAGGVLALTVLGGGAVAVAQTPAGDAITEAAGAPGGVLDRLRERRAERRAEWTEALAAQLGISADELRDARRGAHETVVAELGTFERPESRPDTDEERDALRAQLQERRDAFDGALAAELGIEVQALRDARVAVVAPRLDDAVASGRITQERADAVVEAVATGQIPQRP
jgi:hypothetical protein